MKDLSSHMMDIVQNSIRAEASWIQIRICEDPEADLFLIEIQDNGCGMDEATLARVRDPFFTSRTVRKVGLGIPLLQQNAERTGGKVSIVSQPGQGTTLTARFGHSHLDRPPLGDVAETLTLLAAANPAIHFSYDHSTPSGTYRFDTQEIIQVLELSPNNSYMEKIKSLADLKKIRDNVQSKIDLREKSEHPENLIQIKVAMATCGIAAGSKETMNYFLNNLEKNGIQAVVTQTGCMGYCFAEPTVEITKPGKEPIVFGHVNCAKAEEIIQKYLKNDELVEGIIPVNYQSI